MKPLTSPIQTSIEIESDDGRVRVERVLHNGKEIGRNVVYLPSPEEQAQAAAVQARCDVLAAVVDPSQKTPPATAQQEAHAFLRLRDELGIEAAMTIAKEV